MSFKKIKNDAPYSTQDNALTLAVKSKKLAKKMRPDVKESYRSSVLSVNETKV